MMTNGPTIRTANGSMGARTRQAKTFFQMFTTLSFAYCSSVRIAGNTTSDHVEFLPSDPWRIVPASTGETV